MIVDVWSREIVGWSIHPEESEEHARALFERLCLRRDLKGTWLHADNGNPMKGTTHRHSGIGYVTPEQRRTGQSSELFELRSQTLLEAWERHPERFPRKEPRLWKEQRVVYLNPSAETRRLVINKAA